MSEFDIKSSTIDKSLDIAKEFLQRFVGPSVDEMGLLISDNVRLWRLKNQIRNLEKIKAICEKEKVNTKQINLKVLFPYLDGVSLEVDETLQDMWANLFVNYIDSDKNLTINVYPTILSQISTDEVKILLYMEMNGLDRPINTIEEIRNKMSGIEVKDELTANLVRLGIIQDTIMTGIGGLGNANTGIYTLTTFGKEFLKACKR